MHFVIPSKINPGGKLSETFPVAYADLPVSQYYPGTEAASEYREGLYVGYRYATTAKKEVRFPFGFHQPVRREGHPSCPGAEGLRPCPSGGREEKAVTIPFDEYTFRYFNVQTNKFEVEGGAYDILIAASSEDIRLRGTLEVKGTGAPDPYAASNPAKVKLLDCCRACDVHAVPDASFAALLGHPIPQKNWDRNRPLELNDTIRQMAYAKNPICRMVAKLPGSMIDKAIASGKSDLNLLFIYNITFRGMGKMMGGMITMERIPRWIREGGLFVIVSNVVTVFKYLILTFLPLTFKGLWAVDFGWPGIEAEIFGQPFTWNIFGYAVKEGGAVMGGLGYFIACMIAMVIGEAINFPIQRSFVFRSKRPVSL